MLSAVLLMLLSAGVGAASGSCSLQNSTVPVFDYTPVNTIVAQLSAAVGSSDIDVATTNSFSVGIPFRLLPNASLQLTGAFTVTGVMNVYCTDTNFAQLILARVETDDNAPVWTQEKYAVSVPEDQAVPHILSVKPEATDADGPDSGQRLEYAILPGPFADHFRLNNPEQLVMNITMVRQLDYELVQEVQLGLRVRDFNSSGALVFEVNATLTVTVVNVDDVNPRWLNCSGASVCYERQLLSNSSAGAKILPPVRAVDGDFGSTVAIVYSILSQSPSAIVSIDNATGELTLTRSLPPPGAYQIFLVATQSDKPEKNSNAKLLLSVVSTSYVPPVFEKAVVNATVRENAKPGDVVTIVKATDHLGSGVEFALVSHADTFSVDSSSGSVSVRGGLDYETTSFYAVNVSASDSSGSSFAVVNVFVENVNEFSPTFGQAEYQFAAARRERGLAVGSVSANDSDGDSVTFSIPDAEFAKLFAVGAADGVVRLNAAGSSLPLRSYRFSVAASDGSRAASAAVSVAFDSALAVASTASTTVVALSVLGGIFALIILASIAAFLLARCRSQKELKEPAGSQLSVHDGFAYADLYGDELNGTSRQDNPIEGYNNYMFGDEDAPDISPFNRERDQSEIFVSDTLYHNETVDYSTLTNGSIHTFSGSSLGSQRTLIAGHPRQLHNGSNLQVVQVENAIDPAAGGSAAAGQPPGLTVYF